MNYTLKNADLSNANYLFKCCLNNILKYSNDISKNEKEEINNYVLDNIKKEISKYKLIMIDNNIIGCLLVKDYKDGKLIEEIYIEYKYRNKNIGSRIINNFLKQNTYLWVYKKNDGAIKLYKKLGFNVIEETKTRYFMKYGDKVEN